MYCRDCTGMQTHHDGDGLPHHYCTYTGVTVCPLVIGAGADERDNASPHEADNPTAVCPRNLQTMIGNEDGRRQVRGVLRLVEERGGLDALLATYPARTVGLLVKVLRRVRPSTMETDCHRMKPRPTPRSGRGCRGDRAGCTGAHDVHRRDE